MALPADPESQKEICARDYSILFALHRIIKSVRAFAFSYSCNKITIYNQNSNVFFSNSHQMVISLILIVSGAKNK